MRIALVDAYFIPEVGYQPTGWFDAFVARGHTVRAFASPFIYSYLAFAHGKRYPAGLTELNGGEVLRLPARLLPHGYVRCSGLLQQVQEFKPDLTFAIYPATMFADELFARRRELPGVLISAFGDNRGMRRGHSRIKRALLDLAFFVYKRRLYRMYINNSDVVLLQTPDTWSYVLERSYWSWERQRAESRCVPFTLGFAPHVFHVDIDARQSVRKRLGLGDDEVVAVHSGKISPEKRYDVWVSVMATAMREVPGLRAMIVGVRENHPDSAKVLRQIEQTGMKDRFICLPFADREELPRLYNAADFGVWFLQPSITIQEAMGTGLYMILPRAQTMSQLVRDPETGRYFREEDWDHMLQLVTDTARAFIGRLPVSSPEARLWRSGVNADRFGYLVMADRLLAAAADVANAPRHLDIDSPPPQPMSVPALGTGMGY